MKNFDSRTYSISDFLEWYSNGQLELNPKFQRRSVWDDNARSYLMDTIIRGFPIPKVFIRQKLNVTIITEKPKAHAFKNEMCFPLTKTKCELKKHPNSKFECFFNDFNRTKTSLFLPFPSKLIQDNLVCVLELQE